MHAHTRSSKVAYMHFEFAHLQAHESISWNIFPKDRLFARLQQQQQHNRNSNTNKDSVVSNLYQQP
jgi:hypothetical protein